MTQKWPNFPRGAQPRTPEGVSPTLVWTLMPVGRYASCPPRGAPAPPTPYRCQRQRRARCVPGPEPESGPSALAGLRARTRRRRDLRTWGGSDPAGAAPGSADTSHDGRDATPPRSPARRRRLRASRRRTDHRARVSIYTIYTFIYDTWACDVRDRRVFAGCARPSRTVLGARGTGTGTGRMVHVRCGLRRSVSVRACGCVT
jgi:hypothetical protein